MRQDAPGLVSADDEVSLVDAAHPVFAVGVVVHPAGETLSGVAVLNAVAVEEFRQALHPPPGGSAGDDVSEVLSGRFRPGFFEVAAEVARQAVAFPAAEGYGVEGRRVVVLDAVPQGEGVAVGEVHGPPAAVAAPLLVGHPDGSVEDRVGIAVAGVKQVKALGGEVEPAVLVEGTGVVLADLLLKVALPARNVLVVGGGGGGEVVGGVVPLLVQVGVEVGHPLQVVRHALPGFGLRLPGPVPVQVEEVVIDAPAGPGLTVFPAHQFRIWEAGGYLAVPVRVAVVAVGVQGGVDDDDGVLQPVVRRPVVRVRQRVQDAHAGLAARRFVAVDAEAEPDDGVVVQCWVRLAGQQARLPEVVLPDGLHPLQVGGGRDVGQQQGAPLIGPSVLLQPDAGTLLGYVLEVIYQQMMGSELRGVGMRQESVGVL